MKLGHDIGTKKLQLAVLKLLAVGTGDENLMIRKLCKLWHYTKYAIACKKIWTRPRGSEILIYDAMSQVNFMDYLSEWNPEIIHVDGGQVNIRVLLSQFQNSVNTRINPL